MLLLGVGGSGELVLLHSLNLASGGAEQAADLVLLSEFQVVRVLVIWRLVFAIGRSVNCEKAPTLLACTLSRPVVLEIILISRCNSQIRNLGLLSS